MGEILSGLTESKPPFHPEPFFSLVIFWRQRGSHVTAPPLRLFVAAYPPPEIARRLLDFLASLNPRNLKLTAPDQVHLTLQFIQRPPHNSTPYTSPSAAPSPALSQRPLPSNLSSPYPERPRRLIAAALEPHPTLLALHRRLAFRLSKNTKELSKNHFLPHMTLGRYPTLGDRIEAPIPGPPSFEVSQAVLVQSVLHSSGAEHRLLATFPLKKRAPRTCLGS